MSNFKRNDINCKYLLTKDSLVEDTIKVYAEEFYSLRGMWSISLNFVLIMYNNPLIY